MGYRVTAIILAGGEGRRFGAEKARLAWGRSTLLEYLVERLRPLADEILVSVRERRQAPPLRGPVRIVEDLVSDAHALGGLYSGLRAARYPHCLVWATDAPFVSATLVRWLYRWVGGVDLVIPCSSNGFEPLHAVYAKSALPVIEEHIRCRRWDLRALVPDLRATVVPLEVVRRLDPQRLSFTNINTPEDYQRAQAIHPAPRKPRPSGRGGRGPDPEGGFPEATAVRPWSGVHARIEHVVGRDEFGTMRGGSYAVASSAP